MMPFWELTLHLILSNRSLLSWCSDFNDLSDTGKEGVMSAWSAAGKPSDSISIDVRRHMHVSHKGTGPPSEGLYVRLIQACTYKSGPHQLLASGAAGGRLWSGATPSSPDNMHKCQGIPG